MTSPTAGGGQSSGEAPLPISFEDVLEAGARLEGVANRTPVLTSRTLDRLAGRSCFLKCESFQRGGAFKFRGAYNRISRLSPEERRRGVVAFSSGNHAQGVALAARLLDVPATVAMPDDAPPVKLAATREYGAKVVFYDRLREDRHQVGARLASERGLTLIPPYDDPAIMAGQGTAALELLEVVPDLDAVVAPVSGGGLLAGTATAAQGARAGVRVFGVEPEDADDTRRSLAAGERVTIAPPATVADGLRVQTPGVLTFPVLRRRVEAVLTVPDDLILEAVRFLLLRMKLVVEPSGAVPVAAALAGILPPDCRRVGIIVSGGNLDPALTAVLWKDVAAAASPDRRSGPPDRRRGASPATSLSGEAVPEERAFTMRDARSSDATLTGSATYGEGVAAEKSTRGQPRADETSPPPVGPGSPADPEPGA